MKIGINPVPEQAEAIVKEAGWKFIVCYQAGEQPDPSLDIIVYGRTVLQAFDHLAFEMKYRNRLWKENAMLMALHEGKNESPKSTYEY